MKGIENNSDLLTKEESKNAVNEIIEYFKQEHQLELGLIGAGGILEFFLESISPKVYNKGVEDSRQVIRKEVEDIDTALDVSLRS